MGLPVGAVRVDKILVGYQGMSGSNSEVASLKYIEKAGLTNVELLPCISSENVVKSVVSGASSIGVVAVLNSSAGEVAETKKALSGVDFKELGRVTIPIKHCAFVLSEEYTKPEQVMSHPQALKQCSKNLEKMFPNIEKIPVEDTAIAAKYLKTGEIPPNTLVICSEKAGREYGLLKIAENISDKKDNRTEFLIFEDNK